MNLLVGYQAILPPPPPCSTSSPASAHQGRLRFRTSSRAARTARITSPQLARARSQRELQPHGFGSCPFGRDALAVGSPGVEQCDHVDRRIGIHLGNPRQPRLRLDDDPSRSSWLRELPEPLRHLRPVFGPTGQQLRRRGERQRPDRIDCVVVRRLPAVVGIRGHDREDNASIRASVNAPAAVRPGSCIRSRSTTRAHHLQVRRSRRRSCCSRRKTSRLSCRGRLPSRPAASCCWAPTRRGKPISRRPVFFRSRASTP